jgi:hypothetical protein
VLRRFAPTLFAVVASCALAACKEVPHGGVRASGDAAADARPKPPAGPRVARRVSATDLVPGDLDLVVRLDLARVRAQLGADAVDRLFARALVEAAATPGALVDVDPLLALAARRGEVLTIALRAEDPTSGDRVVVVEGKLAGLEPEAARFRAGPPVGLEGVRVFDRVGALDHASRDATARVVAVADRALAFVSPVEVDAVARVLRDGPDPKRGDPAAEGLVSVDLRVRRLAPALERRFPSLGAVVAGLDRARGTATLKDDGLAIDLAIVGASEAGAERLLRFVDALREGGAASERARVLASLSAERTERTVRVRWTVPAALLLGALADEKAAGR